MMLLTRGARNLPASGSAVWVGLATVLTFFGGFGAWAALAPLDGSVIGGGSLAVQGSNKTVQHREGGIVSALLVQEGDSVARGQILVRLDSTQARTALDVHLAQLAGDRALCARDIAELRDAREVTFPSELVADNLVAASVTARERIIFDNHRTLLLEQLRIVDERLAQSRQQSAGAIAQHESAMRGLAYGTQQLQALVTLEGMGLAARNTVLELSRSIESLRGETGQLQSDIARHDAESAELHAEKLRLHAAAQSDAAHELREAQLRINDVIPRVAADRDILNRLDIRAPVSGKVVNLQAFTTGGIIEPGKPIMQIVPGSHRIIAIAEVRPEDIEHLHVGQAARVIATGFNARETAPMEGRVDVISADCITDPRTGRTYYTVEVALLADHQAGALIAKLDPGMPIEAVISVKSRTALEYLLEPLETSLRSAGREL